MLCTISELPLVSETQPEQLRDSCTRHDSFCIRNHFGVLQVDVDAWRLITVHRSPFTLTRVGPLDDYVGVTIREAKRRAIGDPMLYLPQIRT